MFYVWLLAASYNAEAEARVRCLKFYKNFLNKQGNQTWLANSSATVKFNINMNLMVKTWTHEFMVSSSENKMSLCYSYPDNNMTITWY